MSCSALLLSVGVAGEWTWQAALGKPWENGGFSMGKPEENHRKMVGFHEKTIGKLGKLWFDVILWDLPSGVINRGWEIHE